MSRRFEGQWALVTGASSGIGVELARELAALGASVVLVARRRTELESLAKELVDAHRVEAKVVAMDLGQPGAAEELVDRLDAEGVDVHVLVNNAGFGIHGVFVEMAWERLAMMLQLNITTLVRLTHLLAPRMVARGSGHVMNVASIGAYMPVPTYGAYAATKAFVRNFTEALDDELRGTGVRAVSVCPGSTATEFVATSGTRITDFGSRMTMSAAACARIAVRAMLKGRRNVVTGRMNAVMMWMLRLLPRRWMASIGRKSIAASVAG